jgi:hypothetical protein
VVYSTADPARAEEDPKVFGEPRVKLTDGMIARFGPTRRLFTGRSGAERGSAAVEYLGISLSLLLTILAAFAIEGGFGLVGSSLFARVVAAVVVATGVAMTAVMGTVRWARTRREQTVHGRQVEELKQTGLKALEQQPHVS